ncbi:hypothetical protein ATN91_13520 [Companilactobacillus kimchii]|nr:hypothetical protein ATN91_13520 [Companilactobacillus kimchii]
MLYQKCFYENESGVIIFLGFKWMFELFLDFFLPEIDVQLPRFYGICLFHLLHIGGYFNYLKTPIRLQLEGNKRLLKNSTYTRKSWLSLLDVYQITKEGDF